MIVDNAAPTADDWYFYHLDAQGSVVALSQFDGSSVSVVEKYRYDAFGRTKVCNASGTPLQNNVSAVGNPYMFTSRRYDAETELYYYRARMYDPALGRFMQPDPIGYADGMNMSLTDLYYYLIMPYVFLLLLCCNPRYQL